jgi:integrase
LAQKPDTRRSDLLFEQFIARKMIMTTIRIARSRALVSRRLSQRLPYYLTPDAAHALIDAAKTERDSLLLRFIWEAGVRISKAISLRLEDVGREGIIGLVNAGQKAYSRAIMLPGAAPCVPLGEHQETEIIAVKGGPGW